MYRNHKRYLTLIFVLVFSITYYLKCDFKDIASDCISIISIALAIYAVCISNLIGSPLLEKLKATVDNQITHKTQLGVIKKYIQNAMAISIVTIISSCIIKITSYTIDNTIFEAKILYVIFQGIEVYQIYSSSCFGLFSLNFGYLWIIFIFIINRQVIPRV